VNTDNDNSESSEPEPAGMRESEITGVLDPDTAEVTTETITSDDKDIDEDERENDTSEKDAYYPDPMAPSVQITYGLMPQKPRDDRHIYTYLVHHLMTQYSLKSRLKKFQKKGEEAILKELPKLYMRDTFQPQDADKLSTVQKRGALESLMF
jgi:hypothetical protein